MAAIVTDQFRILNASNFVDSVSDTNNSYYVFLSLPNPSVVGYGRSTSWDTNTPAPVDNLDYLTHVKDTMIFGKKITTDDVRRLVRRVDWKSGTIYEMYRHDYSVAKPSPQTNSTRLYDANYYVMNSDYRVYICIDNGSSESNPNGKFSQDEPKFTDLEPSRAGESGDGYVWKYLFTVSPSDIIKFDAIEYIPIPNDWLTSTDAQIQSIRENGDSTINENQIKKVYIENEGAGYNATDAELDIVGDGTGGKVIVDVVGGKVTGTNVSAGGKNYSYGRVDLSTINQGATEFAHLIPVIPPSRGHGYDLYNELGTDKVLIYARFDDSSKDFPTDTRFAQIGVLKNPTQIGSASSVFTEGQFSNLKGLKLTSVANANAAIPGNQMLQTVTGVGTAKGYIASYDSETTVLKYYTDRSLFYNTALDQKDSKTVNIDANKVDFSGGGTISSGTFSGTIDAGFTGITTAVTSTKSVNLNTQFINGIANPEINKGSGDIIYIDNRPRVSRNPRQKEDIKIILEF
tara:strand:+ start:1063 stop:2610 length:1548 start_codon:yes stop_codon:yes gene_type:complete